jgi:hypothetical protein
MSEPEAWLGFAATGPGPVPPSDPAVTKLRELFTLLDAVLDP